MQSELKILAARACFLLCHPVAAANSVPSQSCRKDVDVPEELKRSLRGKDEEPANRSGNDSLRVGDIMDDVLSSQKSNAEAIKNSGLMNQVLQMYANIKFSPIEYELRVKNASYTVTNHIQAYEMNDAEKNKVHYDTVASSSFVAKFIRKLKHFAKKREWGRKDVTRVLLDDVNLKFESGKMYLVLGVSIIFSAC